LVFFGLIYYKLFNVYGIVAGFSAALLMVLAEGMILAGRSAGNSVMSKVL